MATEEDARQGSPGPDNGHGDSTAASGRPVLQSNGAGPKGEISPTVRLEPARERIKGSSGDDEGERVIDTSLDGRFQCVRRRAPPQRLVAQRARA